jgi:hypothetical protein
MPYTPIDRTSRAVFSGSLSWQNLPPYATFVVPYAFAHFSETAVPDPVSRGLYNQMIDPRLGTWTAGRFSPARPGRHRLSAQFVIYKQSSQGQLVDVFLQLEVIRSGVITTVGICDALYHLVEGGELALPLQVEATPILQPGDQVQARFGLIEGHLINIVTVDPTRTFFDITAYWS